MSRNPHIRVDPEQVEINTLLACTGSLASKRVLEIGCGNGRLTYQYAMDSAETIAIDPNQEKIAQAVDDMPASCATHVHFEAADFLEYKSPHPYEVAIFAWSL